MLTKYVLQLKSLSDLGKFKHLKDKSSENHDIMMLKLQYDC